MLEVRKIKGTSKFRQLASKGQKPLEEIKAYQRPHGIVYNKKPSQIWCVAIFMCSGLDYESEFLQRVTEAVCSQNDES